MPLTPEELQSNLAVYRALDVIKFSVKESIHLTLSVYIFKDNKSILAETSKIIKYTLLDSNEKAYYLSFKDDDDAGQLLISDGNIIGRGYNSFFDGIQIVNQ